MEAGVAASAISALGMASGVTGGQVAGAKRKLWAVYNIVETDARSFWRRVGSAFVNKDGSYNLVLEQVPLNGKLHMREVEPASANERT